MSKLWQRHINDKLTLWTRNWYLRWTVISSALISANPSATYISRGLTKETNMRLNSSCKKRIHQPKKFLPQKPFVTLCLQTNQHNSSSENFHFLLFSFQRLERKGKKIVYALHRLRCRSTFCVLFLYFLCYCHTNASSIRLRGKM